MRARWMRWVVVVGLLAGATVGAAMAFGADAPVHVTDLSAVASATAESAQGQPPARRVGGESSLVLPDLSSVSFRGIDGHTLLLGGLVICALGGLPLDA